ncbi:MAG TPA: hypothetical protein VF125_01170 [Solirubrobacterales bacterium]
MIDRTRRLCLPLSLSVAALILPGPALAAECEGDDCQGPPPAPAEIVPGTAVVEGPQNPPVRFPKARHPKKPDHKKPGGRKHHHR